MLMSPVGWSNPRIRWFFGKACVSAAFLDEETGMNFLRHCAAGLLTLPLDVAKGPQPSTIRLRVWIGPPSPVGRLPEK